MNIQKQRKDGGWEIMASTGNSADYPIQIFRLYDLNTVFEFKDPRDEAIYRVYLPDRDWIKRTDIVEGIPRG